MPDAIDLAEQSCIPCRGGVPPLPPEAAGGLLQRLQGWQIVDHHHLRKEYRFADFRQALAFVDRIGAVAEEQRHHPDVHLSYGKAVVEIWTHKIDGLTESDFILAAKFDRVL